MAVVDLPPPVIVAEGEKVLLIFHPDQPCQITYAMTIGEAREHMRGMKFARRTAKHIRRLERRKEDPR